MPHAEYPSGSTCICQVAAEWGRLFFNGSDTLNIDLYFEKVPGNSCVSIE
jgi:hypothetical protein